MLALYIEEEKTGSSKASEIRIQQLENALYFVLGVQGVRESLENWMSADRVQQVIPDAPSVSVERAKLLESWTEQPLTRFGDIFQFRQRLDSLCNPTEGVNPAGEDVSISEQSTMPWPLNHIPINVQAAELPTATGPANDMVLSPDTHLEGSHGSNLDFLASSAATQLPLFEENLDLRDDALQQPDLGGPTHSTDDLFSQEQEIPDMLSWPSDLPIQSSNAVSPNVLNLPFRPPNPPVSAEAHDIFW
uniref:Uncharacterized protein n=1 Tax=Kwoniella dejecticola CBS 10117 TaxID=1296121 RepID=A0A1A6AB57_9TREE|nr:uncharacterized protein I303_01486 [Kwoniella dejecticola CBS 10117]OBR87284.1 hypothetical protein I303_01486 [Kwoniella dejecticola CBS 10117]